MSETNIQKFKPFGSPLQKNALAHSEVSQDIGVNKKLLDLPLASVVTADSLLRGECLLECLYGSASLREELGMLGDHLVEDKKIVSVLENLRSQVFTQAVNVRSTLSRIGNLHPGPTALVLQVDEAFVDDT